MVRISELHMNYLELLTVLLALKLFLPALQDHCFSNQDKQLNSRILYKQTGGWTRSPPTSGTVSLSPDLEQCASVVSQGDSCPRLSQSWGGGLAENAHCPLFFSRQDASALPWSGRSGTQMAEVSSIRMTWSGCIRRAAP